MNRAGAELKGIDLGDRRLNKRATALLDRLSARPATRIPSACSGWSQTMAASPFFCNDDVT
ncbi:MAG: transposase [Candidatus Accumulibacter sp.]|uniref:Transposase n=1 Tax=Candidatus Accumulibacter proximus TaxID=2954385 RepID=A0A935PZX6_9PROT|nr:transposase [Candidatus Accumulibacter proximus]